MSKIDVSKIEGYEGMTDAEKIAALTSYEVVDEDTSKLQRLLSKANSESAEYKRQLREKQSEAERIAAEREEADKAIREELANAKSELMLGKLNAEYLGLGYSAELAMKSAQAYMAGDTKSVFAYQKEHEDMLKQKADEAALNKQPGLAPGKTPEQIEDKFLAAFKQAAFG